MDYNSRTLNSTYLIFSEHDGRASNLRKNRLCWNKNRHPGKRIITALSEMKIIVEIKPATDWTVKQQMNELEDEAQCWGTWVAQSVGQPTLAQVMISWLMSSNPTSGSVLTAQSLEPASDSRSPSLSALPLLELCPSLKNKCTWKKKKKMPS